MLSNKIAKKTKVAPSTKIPRILNCLPSRNTENDWPLEVAQEAGLVGEVPVLPASVDLRTAWWKIGDQARTGSCVGWAAADGVLRWHFVQSGKLDQSTLLSVRYIWMAAKETDEFTTRPTSFIESDGTSLKAALDIARKYGVVTDSELPFVNGQLYGGKASAFYSMAATRRIASYYALRRPLIPIPASMIVSAFRLWLATKGPILVRLVVDRTFNGLTNDTSGKLDTYKPYPPGASGGHAVAIVGYTPTSFIVRNSWGTDWGDQGFGYASHKYTAAAFAEAYGVIL
jgi:hypothetical protein